MKRNLFAILIAFTVGLSGFVFSDSAVAQSGAPPVTPKKISAEEAAKKYPPPQGKSYPPGEMTSAADGGTPGFIKSPYSSRVYDCRELGRGTLLLDEGAKKVFVRP